MVRAEDYSIELALNTLLILFIAWRDNGDAKSKTPGTARTCGEPSEKAREPEIVNLHPVLFFSKTFVTPNVFFVGYARYVPELFKCTVNSLGV